MINHKTVIDEKGIIVVGQIKAERVGYNFLLSRLGKILSRLHVEIFFFLFSKKIGFDISCKLSPVEMLKHVFREI